MLPADVAVLIRARTAASCWARSVILMQDCRLKVKNPRALVAVVMMMAGADKLMGDDLLDASHFQPCGRRARAADRTPPASRWAPPQAGTFAMFTEGAAPLQPRLPSSPLHPTSSACCALARQIELPTIRNRCLAPRPRLPTTRLALIQLSALCTKEQAPVAARVLWSACLLPARLHALARDLPCSYRLNSSLAKLLSNATPQSIAPLTYTLDTTKYYISIDSLGHGADTNSNARQY